MVTGAQTCALPISPSHPEPPVPWRVLVPRHLALAAPPNVAHPRPLAPSLGRLALERWPLPPARPEPAPPPRHPEPAPPPRHPEPAASPNVVRPRPLAPLLAQPALERWLLPPARHRVRLAPSGVPPVARPPLPVVALTRLHRRAPAK